jgi:hypothetical protein
LKLVGDAVSDAGLCRFLDECHDSLAELTITSCPCVVAFISFCRSFALSL